MKIRGPLFKHQMVTSEHSKCRALCNCTGHTHIKLVLVLALSLDRLRDPPPTATGSEVLLCQRPMFLGIPPLTCFCLLSPVSRQDPPPDLPHTSLYPSPGPSWMPSFRAAPEEIPTSPPQSLPLLKKKITHDTC